MSSAEADVKKDIDRLIAMGADAAKAHKHEGNFGITELKKMAAYLGLPVANQAKAKLVDAIINKMAFLAKADELESSEEDSDDVQTGDEEGDQAGEGGDDDDEDDAELPGAKFKKNKNTMFRLVNLMIKRPAEVQRTSLIATRAQLQGRETGGNNPLFKTVADEFNNDVNSGGLLYQHEEFLSRKINPEEPHEGFITPKTCFKLWKDLVKRYAAAVKRWGQSGVGNELIFWNYTAEKGGPRQVDVLYLRFACRACPDVDFRTYCSEGNEIVGGLETSMQTPSRSSTASSLTSSHRKRRDDAAAVMAEAAQKRAKTLEDLTAAERTVQFAIAERTKVETIARLWKEHSFAGSVSDKFTPLNGTIIHSVPRYAASPIQ
jgi:hypothetical protein